METWPIVAWQPVASCEPLGTPEWQIRNLKSRYCPRSVLLAWLVRERHGPPRGHAFTTYSGSILADSPARRQSLCRTDFCVFGAVSATRGATLILTEPSRRAIAAPLTRTKLLW